MYFTKLPSGCNTLNMVVTVHLVNIWCYLYHVYNCIRFASTITMIPPHSLCRCYYNHVSLLFIYVLICIIMFISNLYPLLSWVELNKWSDCLTNFVSAVNMIYKHSGHIQTPQRFLNMCNPWTNIMETKHFTNQWHCHKASVLFLVSTAESNQEYYYSALDGMWVYCRATLGLPLVITCWYPFINADRERQSGKKHF